MAIPYDIDHRLMEIIVRTPGSSLDDIVSEFPDLTWSQVFLTIDRLSREGALKLTLKGRYLYAVAARSATVLPFRPEFLQSVALLRMNLFTHRDLMAWLDKPFATPPNPQDNSRLSWTAVQIVNTHQEERGRNKQ